MDTTTFQDLAPGEYKRQTQNHWSGSPCGSNYSQEEFGTQDYFEEVERHRYQTHPWILKAIQQMPLAGKRVLEIGYGMGTDHLNLTRQGAIMHGVDLTPRNARIVRHRLSIYNKQSKLTIGDGENLPFADQSFDQIYSFGVIHHSPDTAQIVHEIHRVLRPGGKAWISVYHRNSIFFWWSVWWCDWICKGGFRRDTLQQRLSRIEYPNDNPHMVIRLYRRREFAELFKQFNQVKTSVDHLVAEDVLYLGRWLPQRWLNVLAKRWGWYVIVEATK